MQRRGSNYFLLRILDSEENGKKKKRMRETAVTRMTVYRIKLPQVR